jgi:hypothetical protein
MKKLIAVVILAAMANGCMLYKARQANLRMWGGADREGYCLDANTPYNSPAYYECITQYSRNKLAAAEQKKIDGPSILESFAGIGGPETIGGSVNPLDAAGSWGRGFSGYANPGWTHGSWTNSGWRK